MKHRPRKRFGQNFLHDPGIIGRIVSMVDPRPGERLVEIGPGRGAITTGLLKAARHLDVVERIAARPGSKVYGRLSVMIQVYCRAEPLFRIGPGAFTPAPKVDSAFLRLTPHRPLPIPVLDPSFLSLLVAQAFAQRRKILRNSLKGLVSAQQLQAQGLDPGRRAEELSVETFVHLANTACKTQALP